MRVGPRQLPLEEIAQDQRAFRQLLRNNAETAVLCLNSSEGTAAHVRIVELHRKLEELQEKRVELQCIYLPLRRADKTTARGAELAKQFKYSWKKMRALIDAINERLARYAFRPFVAYLSAGDQCLFEMVPDMDWKSVKLGDNEPTEADAVLSLVRLSAKKELRKVHLCSQCKARWHVARRSIDRFCSTECREAFYIESPDYKPRKRENQRKYREQKKRNGLL